MDVPNDSIVGRELELATVNAFFEDRAALPAGMLIVGEAGIGKSTLWEAVVERAQGIGFRVIQCRPAGGEVRLSYAALTDLLEPDLELVLPVLPPPQRRALELALLVRDDDDRPPDQRAVAAASLHALRSLAQAGPLLIAIDDAHWLDAPSAAAIEYAVRRLRDEPIAILASARSEVSALPPLDLGRALGRRLNEIAIGPLSLGALQRMLRQRTGQTFDRPTLRRIHDTSGGNPFYALELARAAGEGVVRRLRRGGRTHRAGACDLRERTPIRASADPARVRGNAATRQAEACRARGPGGSQRAVRPGRSTVVAAKAQAELARIGGRTSIGGLTATERRVADLVAEGRSNKEVAAELFVSVRAVEANLSKVYAKLGVRSRTELARRL